MSLSELEILKLAELNIHEEPIDFIGEDWAIWLAEDESVAIEIERTHIGRYKANLYIKEQLQFKKIFITITDDDIINYCQNHNDTKGIEGLRMAAYCFQCLIDDDYGYVSFVKEIP